VREFQEFSQIASGSPKKEKRAKKDVCIVITNSWADFAIIGVRLCSTMTAIFLQKHFVIRLNGPRFGSGLFLFLTFGTTTISGNFGVGDS